MTWAEKFFTEHLAKMYGNIYMRSSALAATTLFELEKRLTELFIIMAVFKMKVNFWSGMFAVWTLFISLMAIFQMWSESSLFKDP